MTGLESFFKQQQLDSEKYKKEHGPDYMAASLTFGLNKAEHGEVNAWYKSLLPEILAIQKSGSGMRHIGDKIQGEDQPYYGAVGGGLSYTFTPTALGDIITVKESITGKELNVSEATGWVFYG